MATIRKLKHIDKRTNLIVIGFIRSMERMLLALNDENKYFVIPQPVSFIILSNIDNHFTQNKKCICGQQLIDELIPSTTYRLCDICFSTIQNATSYHCPINKNDIHPYGYDLCAKCILKTERDTITPIHKLKIIGFEVNDICAALYVAKGDFDVALCHLIVSKHEKLKVSKQNVVQQSTNIDDDIVGLENKGFPTLKCLNAYTEANGDTNLALTYLNNNSIPNRMRSVFDGMSQPQYLERTLQIVNMMNNGMKFTEKQCSLALAYTDNKVTQAVSCLIAGDCYGDVSKCKYVFRIILVLKKLNNNNKLKYDDIDIIQFLNDFNHILYKHNTDNDCAYIYNIIGKCNVLDCNLFKRHYRPRNIQSSSNLNDNDNDKKDNHDTVMSVNKDLLDKAHCYLVHSYDMGYRLLPSQRNFINNKDQKNDIDGNRLDFYDITEQRLNEIKKIVMSKNTVCKNIVDNSSNKFNQSSTLTSTGTYHIGQQLYYWDYFKNNQTIDKFNSISGFYGLSFAEKYVSKKYQTFKQELTYNELATISLDEWIAEYLQAEKNCKTDHAKTMKAIHDEQSMFYGITEGSLIKLHHLLAITVYCNYTHLSYAFSASFRQNSNEKDKEFKARHRNFYHLSKYVAESIHLFSLSASYHKITTFYHGINKELIFNGLRCRMHQPFSATSAFEVAINFSNKTGVVLEIGCAPPERYFDCMWLSKYPDEKELLFIHCRYALQFRNIINTQKNKNYEIFIQGLSIIDQMINGKPFEKDDSVRINISNRGKRNTMFAAAALTLDPIFGGGRPISPFLKLLTIKLIKHQLSKSNPTKYDPIQNIEPYVDKLMNNICIKKKIFYINWRFINVEMTNKWASGYQGYLFLKYLFFEPKSQILNFDLILSLFPNILFIALTNISFNWISSKFLNKLLEFMKSPKSKTLYFIGFTSDEHCIGNNMLKSLEIKHKEKFHKEKLRLQVSPETITISRMIFDVESVSYSIKSGDVTIVPRLMRPISGFFQ